MDFAIEVSTHNLPKISHNNVYNESPRVRVFPKEGALDLDPHLGNVLTFWALPIVKHRAEVITSVNISTS